VGGEKNDVFFDIIGIYVHQRPIRVCLRIAKEGNFCVKDIFCLADEEADWFGQGHLSLHDHSPENDSLSSKRFLPVQGAVCNLIYLID